VAGTLALLAAALVALTAGTVLLGRANARVEQERATAQRQRDLAADNARKARQAVNDYFTTVSENTLLKSPLPGLQPLRRELLQTALRYYQEFVREQGDDLDLRSDLAAAYLRMGKITTAIGSKDEALSDFQKSLAHYRALAEAKPGDVDVRRGLAESLHRVADTQGQIGQTAEALQSYREAIAVSEPLGREHPEDPELRHELATIYNGLGSLQKETGEPANGFASLDRARAILVHLTELNPKDRKYRNHLAGVYSNIGELQVTGLAQFAEGLQSYQAAVDIDEQLAKEDPSDLLVQDYLSVHYGGIGTACYYMKRWPQCLEANQKAVTGVEKLARENPRVTRYQSNLAQRLVNLGQIQLVRLQVDKSLENLQRAVDVAEGGLREFPDETEFHYALGQALQSRAHCMEIRGRTQEMITDLERAVAEQRQAVERAPDMMVYSQALGTHWFQLGIAQARMGQAAKARPSWQQAARVWEGYASAHPADRGYRYRMVGKLLLLAQAQAGARLEDDAVATQRRALALAEELVRAQPENQQFQAIRAQAARALQKAAP
jgi:tetratricopeptide (TPR) repeat protein